MDDAQPTYDIEKIRKAYNRVLSALTQAKADGNAELVAKYRADYMALKDLLAKANEQQRAQKQEQDAGRQVSKDETADLQVALKAKGEELAQLRKQLEEAQAANKEQRHTIGALKYEMEILRDEVRTLRSPPPVQEFNKVRLIPPSQINNTEIDWAKEIAAITGQNT